MANWPLFEGSDTILKVSQRGWANRINMDTAFYRISSILQLAIELGHRYGFWLLSRYFRVKIHRAPLYHLRYGSRPDSNLTNGRWKDARCIYYLWLWHPVYIYMELALQGLLALLINFFWQLAFPPQISKVQVNSQASLLFSVWRNRKTTTTTTTTLIDPLMKNYIYMK